MSILFSKSCDYAIQSVIFLLFKPEDKPVMANEISDALQIPGQFLGKILQILVHNGIIHSLKGRHGGYVLSKTAGTITLGDIAQVIDGPDTMEGCLLGLPGCSDKTPCPYHEKWKDIKEKIAQVLDIKLKKIRREFEGDFMDLLVEKNDTRRESGK